MLVKKTGKPHIFDVFLGKQWNFIQIKGNRFTKEEFEEVEMRLCKGTLCHH